MGMRLYDATLSSKRELSDDSRLDCGLWPVDKEETKLNQIFIRNQLFSDFVAIYRLLKRKGYQPDMVTGLSLKGIFCSCSKCALDWRCSCAGYFARGAYMEEAAPAGSGRWLPFLYSGWNWLRKLVAASKVGRRLSQLQHPSQIDYRWWGGCGWLRSWICRKQEQNDWFL